MSNPEASDKPELNQPIYNEFELNPLSAEELYLAEVAQVYGWVDEIDDKHSAKLNQIIQSAAETAVTPEERRAIELTGGITRWKMFGTMGDPLPEGLTVTNFYNDVHVIQYDLFRLNINQYAAADKTLKAHGLTELYNELSPDKTNYWKEEADKAATAVVTTCGAYKLFSALGVEQPALTTEVPLDRVRKLGRHQEIYHAYDGETLEKIQPKTTAQAAQWFAGNKLLQRAVRQLDHQTMQVPTAQPENPTVRARQILAPGVARSFFHGPFDLTNELKTLTRYYPGSDIPEPASWKTFETLSRHELLKCIYPAGSYTGRQVAIDAQFLNKLARCLFTTPPSKPFSEILDMAATQTAATFLSQLSYAPKRVFDLRPYPHLADVLAAPKAPFIPEEKVREYREPPKHGVGFSTKAEIQRDRETILGRVEYGNPGTMRLITRQPKNEQLPPHPSSVALVISLEHADYEHFDPDIPGYELVSRQDNQYGFVRSAQDPYKRVPVYLSPEEINTISTTYKEMGLETLSRKLLNSTGTLGELMDLLSRYTNYPLPKTTGPGGELPASIAVKTLHDYIIYVRKNRLIAQCGGSSDVAKKTIDALYGAGYASIMVGHTVDPDGIIDAETHAQVAFRSPDGVFQIYDTAGSNVSLRDIARSIGAPIIRWWAGRDLRKTLRNAPEKTIAPAPLESTDDSEAIAAERRKIELNGVATSLEKQLQVALGVPTRDELFKKVVKLPKGVDPVRRTVELVLRTKNGDSTPEQLIELHRYLTMYKGTSPQERDRVGVESYGSDLLKILSTATQGLALYYDVYLEEPTT